MRSQWVKPLIYLAEVSERMCILQDHDRPYGSGLGRYRTMDPHTGYGDGRDGDGQGNGGNNVSDPTAFSHDDGNFVAPITFELKLVPRKERKENK